MTNPAGIDLATGEGVFVSTHGGGDLSVVDARGTEAFRLPWTRMAANSTSISTPSQLVLERAGLTGAPPSTRPPHLVVYR
jgi:hypothetical protein